MAIAKPVNIFHYKCSKCSSIKITFYLTKMLARYYICDNCFTPLKIHANLTFNVVANTDKNFNEDYVSSYKKIKKLKLEETSLFDD